MPFENEHFFTFIDANVEETHKIRKYNPFSAKFKRHIQTINVQKLKTFPTMIYQRPRRQKIHTKNLLANKLTRAKITLRVSNESVLTHLYREPCASTKGSQ